MTLRACSCVRVSALSRKFIECNRYAVGAFVVWRGPLTGPKAQALLLRWRSATTGAAALTPLLPTFLVILFKLFFLIIVQNGFDL
jgi:hypothetical protein